MPLSQASADLADRAISAVEGASTRAHAALDSESSILTWATGSDSARAARVEDARQTDKILSDLRARRPGLDDAGLAGFLDLATAGADVTELVAASERMTAAGFNREVVAPTVATIGDDLAAAGSGLELLLRNLPWVLVGLALVGVALVAVKVRK